MNACICYSGWTLYSCGCLYSLCKAAVFTSGPLMLELRVQRTGSQQGKMDVKQGPILAHIKTETHVGSHCLPWWRRCPATHAGSRHHRDKQAPGPGVREAKGKIQGKAGQLLGWLLPHPKEVSPLIRDKVWVVFPSALHSHKKCPLWPTLTGNTGEREPGEGGCA